MKQPSSTIMLPSLTARITLQKPQPTSANLNKPQPTSANLHQHQPPHHHPTTSPPPLLCSTLLAAPRAAKRGHRDPPQHWRAGRCPGPSASGISEGARNKISIKQGKGSRFGVDGVHCFIVIIRIDTYVWLLVTRKKSGSNGQ